MKWLSDYRHRLLPFLALRLARGEMKNIVQAVDVDLEGVEKQLRSTIEEVAQISGYPPPKGDEARELLRNRLHEVLGFSLEKRDSLIPKCGQGVFVSQGAIPKGSLTSLYPGTIYDPGDPLLLQSLGNHFVLRCRDGISIDGNDRRLSRRIHLSCTRRDGAVDVSWLQEKPQNFLNMGHYVNNGDSDFNVQYVDLDIIGWPARLRPFLPYGSYSPMRTAPMRVVVLVATRRIEEGEELLSAYVSR